MKGLRRHPFRVVGRLIWVVFEVSKALLAYVPRCVLVPHSSRRLARAVWLQRAVRQVGHIFNFEVIVTGAIPSRGLLVCNHVSYMDIMALSSLTPAVFVAKREVKSWPFMGLLAVMGGTLFIDRQRRMHVALVNREIQTALDEGTLVVIFPEGTSSDGRAILPFKSSLLESATRQEHPLTVACIEYPKSQHDEDAEVAYWGDAVFLPHLMSVLANQRVRVMVKFAEIQNHGDDRKVLARQLRAEVLKLKG